MAYEFGSISKRMKARKPKTKAGRGVAAGAEGFLKGVQQGLQMGMYRAMQQQKVGETENEKYAKQLDALKRSITYDPTGEIKSGITILSDQVRQAKITIQDARDLVDAKGWRDPSGFRKKEDFPKNDEQLSAEHAETLRKEGQQRGEPGRIMTAAEVLAETSIDEASGVSIPMPPAPPGQVWWKKPGEKPVLIGAAMRAEPKETFTKPQPFQKIGTQEIVYIGWDKNKNSFVLKGDTEDTSLTYAEVTQEYTPKSKDMFTQMMVEIMGQVVTQLKEEE